MAKRFDRTCGACGRNLEFSAHHEDCALYGNGAYLERCSLDMADAETREQWARRQAERLVRMLRTTGPDTVHAELVAEWLEDAVARGLNSRI